MSIFSISVLLLLLEPKEDPNGMSIAAGNGTIKSRFIVEEVVPWKILLAPGAVEGSP